MKMNNLFRLIFVVPVLVAFLVIGVGCTPKSSASGSGGPGPEHGGNQTTRPVIKMTASGLTGKWTLVSLAGNPLANNTRITLGFGKGRMGGSGGCNGYSGRYTADTAKGTLKPGSLIRSSMACQPRIKMQQESQYLALLGQVRRFKRTGNRLVLTTGKGDALEYRFQPPPAIRPLEGTKWKVSGFAMHGAVGSPVRGMSYTLSFHQGKVTGTINCNSFSGTYTVGGKQMTIKGVVVSTKGCPGVYTASQAQEFLQLLGATTSYRIQRNRMQLFAPGGKGLYLHAR